MSAKNYIVVENTPGYLPEEDDPYVTGDLGSAREYLKERVESYCDHLCEGYDYAAGYEPTVYWSEDLTFAHVNDPERSRDLGRAFEIVEEEA